MNLKYIIASTGRSGTVYMARLLTSVGVPCGHESIFTWQGIEKAKNILCDSHKPNLSYTSSMDFVDGIWIPKEKWLENIDEIEAESSYMAVPFLSDECLKDTKIIHVVRNPIKVINSFCNHIGYFKEKTPQNIYEEFIYSFLPELKEEMSYYERSSLYYIRWNQLIEKANPDLFHRIEDNPIKIFDFINKNGDYFNDKKINTYKSRTNDYFNLHKIQSEIIKSELIQIMKKYNYSMGANFL